MENKKNNGGKIIHTKESQGMTRIVTLHDDIRIQKSINVYDNYRVCLVSLNGNKELGLNVEKRWYFAQVLMEAGWMDLAEPDKNMQPIIKYFETEKICREYIMHMHDKQIQNLKGIGLKKLVQGRDKFGNLKKK